MIPHRRLPSRRSGFTLLEVILAMSLSFFLLAALYQAIVLQAKYAEAASIQMHRPQLARTLLHQIAEEIRSATAPIALGPLKESVELLRLGEMAAPGPTEAPAPFEPLSVNPPALDARPAGAERFAILGTSNRLIIQTHKSSVPRSRLDEEEMTDPPMASLDPTKKNLQALGLERTVFYFLKPIPEAERKKTAEQAEGAESKPGQEPVASPQFRGLARQEVSRPFAADGWRKAKEQALELIEPPREDAAASAPDEARAREGLSLDKPKGPPSVTTRMIAGDIFSIRFRYHDGLAWRPEWLNGNAVPVAIEISISFDPRSSDPDYHPPERPQGSTMTQEESPSPSSSEGEPLSEGLEPPLFPYSLTVALPTANPAKPLAKKPRAEIDSLEAPPPCGQEPPLRLPASSWWRWSS